MAKKKKGLAEGSRQLVELDYPIYSVACTGDYAIIGGGGGKSRTGVPNVLVCVHLSQDNLRFSLSL